MISLANLVESGRMVLMFIRFFNASSLHLNQAGHPVGVQAGRLKRGLSSVFHHCSDFSLVKYLLFYPFFFSQWLLYGDNDQIRYFPGSLPTEVLSWQEVWLDGRRSEEDSGEIFLVVVDDDKWWWQRAMMMMKCSGTWHQITFSTLAMATGASLSRNGRSSNRSWKSTKNSQRKNFLWMSIRDTTIVSYQTYPASATNLNRLTMTVDVDVYDENSEKVLQHMNGQQRKIYGNLIYRLTYQACLLGRRE